MNDIIKVLQAENEQLHLANNALRAMIKAIRLEDKLASAASHAMIALLLRELEYVSGSAYTITMSVDLMANIAETQFRGQPTVGYESIFDDEGNETAIKLSLLDHVVQPEETDGTETTASA